MQPKTYPWQVFHVFSNNMDDYTTDYKEALAMFDEIVKENGNARLYLETYNDKEADEEGQPSDEDCLKSHGEWPL